MAGGLSSKIYYGWWVVAAGFVTQFVGVGVSFYTFGAFLTALTAEYGWSRGQISLAFVSLSIGFALLAPLVGRWTDRYGPRAVILPAAFAVGLACVLLRSLTPHLLHLCSLYFLMGAGASALITVPVSMASHWFRKKRGLALGVTYIGGGVGGVVIAALTGYLVPSVGFRATYGILGLIAWGGIFLLAAPLIKRKPEELGLLPDGETIDPARPEPATLDNHPGRGSGVEMSLQEAVRTSNFWLLGAALLLTNTGLSSLNQHLVPLLTDKGFSLERASSVLSFSAMVSILGRVVSGYLLDKLVAKYLAMAFYSSFALGLLLLTFGEGGWSIYLASVLFGVALGAEFDILAYMVGQYFGFKSFGEIFGWIYIAALLGALVGPALMGYTFDWTGSYDLAMILFAFLALLAVLTAFSLRSPGIRAGQLEEVSAG